MRFKRIAAFVVLALAGPASGQQIPDFPERDPRNPAVKDAIKTRVDAGRGALAGKASLEAVRHFANALWWDPCAPSLLADLIAASAPSEDAQTLWAHQLAAALADDRGAFEPDPDFRKIAARDPLILKIAAARADAAAQLAAALKELRGRDGDQAISARWAAAVAQEVLGGAPALRKKHAAAFNQALAVSVFEYKPVLSALKEVMDKSLGEQKPELAVRAALCLLGLASQTRFKDLEGPKPPQLESVAMAARAGLARAREQIEAKRKGAITTIAELEAMSELEREKFNEEHASFENPGVTLSPNGLYRIETSCGHATLLGVAKTVELHHARLVKYFGQDPFSSQPGLVRVVPESSGLEAEGTPYWWAGGFQSGSVTTVKFSCGTIGGLGRGLTHELTHRFDGTLNGGIPSWLAEGKAVWTGSAYGGPEDVTFVPNHASFGTVEAGYLKGYGDENKLKTLVEGKLEDYRDNYTAGYGLFLYLSTWKEKDAAIFGDRLAKFEKGCKERGGNSLEWFVASFCDGKAGRPKDFKAFAERFGKFLVGFYWQNRAPWTGTLYTEKVPAAGPDPWVYDPATWHQARNRAEPWFGQDQARIAAEILLEAGRKREAAAAFEWSLLVDEWSPDVADKLARLLEADNRQGAAWIVRNECARRFHKAPPPGLPPAGRVAKAEAFADLLRAAHDAYAPSKPLAAAAFAADHDRLAARLGMKPVKARAAAPATAEALHPLDEPPRALGWLGWEEDKLTGYEERRNKDLWYEVPEGDLHVGRTKPREGTGTMDRAAHQRDAFVRTREWIAAGRYAVTARIQVTTSYVSGAVILGYTRRDRNVRFHFDGGDFLYSIGAKDEKFQFDSVGASLHGLKERDGPLWGSTPHHRIKFPSPTNTFTVRLLVDGPQVHAYVNDELIGTYHTTDGSAVEGYVGFASGQGAYLVAAPSVQRRDRSAALGTDPLWPTGLDIGVAGKQARREVLNVACRGIPTGPSGTVVLWIPEIATASGDATLGYSGIVTGCAIGLDDGLKEDGRAATFLVALPEKAGEDFRQAIEIYLKENVARFAGILVHKHAAPLTTHRETETSAIEPTPTVLYVDPGGVVRVAERFERGHRTLPAVLRQWLNVFEALASAQKSPTQR
jgi:hypothetical protein